MELDVDHLKSSIRAAALKRHPNLDGHQSIPFGWLPQTTQTNHQRRLILSPEFTVRSDNTYHVNDLLKYHDRDFVKNAYRAILKREPDEAGFQHNLELLRSGVFNKIDILKSLRYSDEGELNGANIAGLKFPATIRALERVPVIGYLLQLLIAFVRMPATVRSQRQFQGYIVAQQLAIADHVNASGDEFQRNSSTLANQLRALEQTVETVNETVMARLLTEQEKLQHAEAQILLINDRLANVSESLSQTLFETRQALEAQIGELTTDVQTLGRNLAAEENRTIEELREWDNFYAAFEEQFRGSSEEVEERLRFYLPFVQELKPDSRIVDLGSGRGDWLQLLTKEGFKPHGVEVNEVMAERSREQGLEVSKTEMMVYLGQQPDDSLDLVTVFHLIEHFNVGKLIRLLDEIRRTLKPGGLLFLETPSPENLVVGACNFYADPTHHKPIYPQTLMFLLSNKGFVDLNLKFLHAVDNSPFAGKADRFQQLDTWFYGPRDFSVIARKAH